MAVEIKMPQLSDTMNAGKILSWNKKEGDEVKRGDILAEVETEKANLEIESFNQGTLLKILVPADTSAKVGEVIAVIGQAGEKWGDAPQQAAPAAAAAAPAAAPSHASNAPASGAQTDHGSSERIKASPLARKLAEHNQIDLSTVHGSGPNGRIVKRDIEAASHTPAAPQQQAPAIQQAPSYGGTPVPATPAPVAYQPPPQQQPQQGQAQQGQPQQGQYAGRLTPLSKMRETIARRMQESVVQAPHFFTTVSIDMEEAMRLREVLKGRPEFKGISVNHLVIKAAAYALSREPRVNRAIKEGMLFEPDSINIGIVTALEDGLLIPVVRDVHTLTLKDVVFEARAAVERARAGRPTASDLSGGTFSISNMGMLDVENFTAIINPGQGAILAVSSVRKEPVVKDDELVIRSRMKVTLSVDHRIIDGIMAGTFLKHFREALETPALLML